MPWAERLPSGRWRGCYRNADNERRTVEGGPFNTKAEALRKAATAEDNARKFDAVDSHAGKITWGAWFEEWMSSHQIAPATVRAYRTSADLHVMPYWADKPLREITLHKAKKWVNRLLVDPVPPHPQRRRNQATGKPRGPHAIRSAVVVFSASLNAAVKAGVLPINRARGLKWLDIPTGPERFLTLEEVQRIEHFLPTERDRLILWVAATTGMRPGEMGGLHTSRVDLDRGLITVQENWDQEERFIEALPKDKERRHVPISPDLAERLGAYIESLPAADDCGQKHRRGRCPGGILVFRGPDGGPYTSGDWGAGDGPFRRAVKLAGIEGRVRVYDLRHTAASWALQDGLSLEVVAELLGHTNLEMTQRYAHLGTGWQNQVSAVMQNRVRRGAAPGARPMEHMPKVSRAGSGRHEKEAS